MSTQVDRLQALLLRVQNNRSKPRPGHAGSFAREAPQVAARAQAPAVAAREALPQPEPARAQPRAELREPPTATVPRPQAAEPRPRAPETAAKLNAPVVSHAVAPDAPRASDQPRIIDPAPAQPSRPVAQVVSKHPQPSASTFGELLRRSLALRPR